MQIVIRLEQKDFEGNKEVFDECTDYVRYSTKRRDLWR